MHDGRGLPVDGGLSWRGRNDGGKAKVGPDDPPIGAGARDPLQIDALGFGDARGKRADLDPVGQARARQHRSEEHTSELQSLMRISYAVFCLKKKKTPKHKRTTI